jgi:hypothetical protein
VDASAIKPDKTDFGGSTYTYRDADYVIGGISPNQMSVQNYMGFVVDEFLTVWHLVKNRWGAPGGAFAMYRQTNVPLLVSLTQVSELNGLDKKGRNDRYSRVRANDILNIQQTNP